MGKEKRQYKTRKLETDVSMPAPGIDKRFKNVMKILMEERGKSKHDIACACRTSPSTVYNWTSESRSGIGFPVVVLLYWAYGVSVDYLWDGRGTPFASEMEIPPRINNQLRLLSSKPEILDFLGDLVNMNAEQLETALTFMKTFSK